ncbi:hypothetical protein P152DRAFT_447339 [Eremomyces bilateralis CBS 781.70]|uniref:Extracellular membrane protein CFEM domain-containing protein n=1 Tax=Eremomyces bilateralis CBS 781.70 TaxID=1392243 RepID=A0A6G1GAZ8_9PEZI|nr:uncharacterized protein P152DRAFT_447339 [Eremomyces bilateralis CBS 781.70]KAF1815080.1 hypothetical protein P152DRAFT_447339 [Eremomyces bilateralis CBS 781.70]
MKFPVIILSTLAALAFGAALRPRALEPCECDPPVCPQQFLDALYICQCHNNHAYACWQRNSRTCQSPSLVYKKECATAAPIATDTPTPANSTITTTTSTIDSTTETELPPFMVVDPYPSPTTCIDLGPGSNSSTTAAP